MRTAKMVPFLFLLLLGGAALLAYRDDGVRAWIFARRLASLPNADYTVFLVDLCEQERYEEAGKLAAFIARHPDMPERVKIAKLRSEIDDEIRRSKTPFKRGAAFLGGFLSGGGTATEARVGGFIAGFLTGQGILGGGDTPKQDRDAADKLASALERAHLGRSKLWFPDAVRVLYRSNLISPVFESFLLKNARESEEKGEALPELQSAAASTQALFVSMGLSYALGIYKEVQGDEDLEQLAMWSRSCPDETYLVAAHGGVSLLPLIPDTPDGRALLTEIAKKGERGVRSALFWLK